MLVFLHSLFSPQKNFITDNWRSPTYKFENQNHHIPVDIYLLQVNNRNTKTRCEICSKLTIKTAKQRQWRRSGVFIVKFEHASHLVFLLLTLNMHLSAGIFIKPLKKKKSAFTFDSLYILVNISKAFRSILLKMLLLQRTGTRVIHEQVSINFGLSIKSFKFTFAFTFGSPFFGYIGATLF